MTNKELIVDALAGVVAGAGFFVVVWIAFGIDVITTGM